MEEPPRVSRLRRSALSALRVRVGGCRAAIVSRKGETMSRREQFGLAALIAGAIAGGTLFYKFIRRGTWGKFW